MNSSVNEMKAVTNSYNLLNQTTNVVNGSDNSYWNYQYDEYGQVTSGERQWNATNLVESRMAVAPAARYKVEWPYDALGRRVSETTYNWNTGTSAYALSTTVLYVYDGWQCIGELNTSKAVQRSYAWGLDMSGTKTGAGGVGGLLMINSTAAGTHYYSYDGNGNVVNLVSATDGIESARYEYDSFGMILRSTGTMALANPFRFSTKRQETKTDVILYEYRPYSPSLGRWLSRDPIGEEGGDNIYAFIDNDVSNYIDICGFRKWIPNYKRHNPPTKKIKITPPKPPKNEKYPAGGPGKGEKEKEIPPSQDNPATPAEKLPEGLNVFEIIYDMYNKNDVLTGLWIKIGIKQCAEMSSNKSGGCKCCVVYLSGRESRMDGGKIWIQATGYVVNMSCKSKEAMDNDSNTTTLSSDHGAMTIYEKHYYNW